MSATAPRPRARPILLALLAALGFAAGALGLARIRTDMASLLPRGQGPAARFMLRELRTGPANRLILIGIEGAPAARLAALSRALVPRLRASGRFALVRNGAGTLAGSSGARFLFDQRYLLSPAVTPAAFTTAALRADLRGVRAGLASAAAPLVEKFGLADPTGAFLPLARAWRGASRIGLRHGVWFAADRPPGGGKGRARALLLAETRAGGTDLSAQDRALGVIRAAFAGLAPKSLHAPGARLVLGGTAVLDQAAARTVRADAERLSILSGVIVALLLVWRFRAPLVIAAILIPVVLGLGAATLIVQAVYGSVQGIAFGFGMTMLGVSLDYPVLLIGHRKRGEAPAETFRRIGRAFTLAAASAVLGLSGMVFAGFPAIAELGVFAATGLAVAALATRFLLPPLLVAAELAPMAFGDPALLHRIEPWRRLRPLGLGLVGLAATVLVATGGPRFAHNLAALSPVPPAALAADRTLREEVGAPDAGQLGLIRAGSAQAVLRAEERLRPRLLALRAAGLIAGLEDAARLLPSKARQRARQAALPTAKVLAARLRVARRGLGFRRGAFAPFLAAVAAARAAAPLGPDALTEPVLAARLGVLLFQRSGRSTGRPMGRSTGRPTVRPLGRATGGQRAAWYGLIAPSGVTDPARVGAALRAGGALYVDVGVEAGRIVTNSTAAALRRLGLGALAALAVLTATGVRISLLQIVALQLAAGVGLDYALFFARPRLDPEERARTLRTLLTCNAMTVLTFGLLATARTPLLRQIGIAVVTGAIATMITAFLFAGGRAKRVTHGIGEAAGENRGGGG